MTSSVVEWLQLGLGMFGIIFLFLILIMLVLIVTLPLALKAKKSTQNEVKIVVKKLNDIYTKQSDVILQSTLSAKEYKKHLKAKKLETKSQEKKSKEFSKNKVFVLDFKGDVGASQVTFLREQVSALLSSAQKTDEIVIRLESPGGLVHTYGLAASQLARIRQAQIPFTVCVDKVAASGGYMMACLADKVLAAPFAILGSIGVIASVPNFNKFLKKHDVEYYEITAGKYKRSLTSLGEPTEEKIEKSHEKVQEVHKLFKDHVKKYREKVDIENIATGDYWYGNQAIDLELVDEIKTSDDYLLELAKSRDLYLVSSPQSQGLRQKIFSGISNLWYTTFSH